VQLSLSAAICLLKLVWDSPLGITGKKIRPRHVTGAFLACRCSICVAYLYQHPLRMLGGATCRVPLAANISPVIPDVPASAADIHQGVVVGEEDGAR
jgi:hypothetical protein